MKVNGDLAPCAATDLENFKSWTVENCLVGVNTYYWFSIAQADAEVTTICTELNETIASSSQLDTEKKDDYLKEMDPARRMLLVSTNALTEFVVNDLSFVEGAIAAGIDGDSELNPDVSKRPNG